ncbi:MAG: glycosyltransferase involved in cell wall biosynthesis [Arcticibacterium sp.]|jgi:glycosyltransferase involved in cell wall biosynthesis
MKQHKILIPSIDSVKEKNILQFSSLSNYGYKFIVISNSIGEVHLERNIEHYPFLKVYVVRGGYMGSLMRLLILFKVVLTQRISLAEIYPHGFFEFLNIVILRILGIKLLFIGRGPEYTYQNGLMPKRQRFFFRFSYRLCENVIMKERYMERMMTELGVKNTFTLPNSVRIPDFPKDHFQHRCNFIFVNSFKVFRYPEVAVEAFIKMMRSQELATFSGEVKLFVIGYDVGDNIISRNTVESLVKKNEDLNISLIPFTKNVEPYYTESDVFLLPASLVYVNHSLLEAMSRGLCPIIQDAVDSDLLMVHGESGFILKPDPDLWKDVMTECVLNTERRSRLGRNAREFIKENFSDVNYTHKYKLIYEELIS